MVVLGIDRLCLGNRAALVVGHRLQIFEQLEPLHQLVGLQRRGVAEPLLHALLGQLAERAPRQVDRLGRQIPPAVRRDRAKTRIRRPLLHDLELVLGRGVHGKAAGALGHVAHGLRVERAELGDLLLPGPRRAQPLHLLAESDAALLGGKPLANLLRRDAEHLLVEVGIPDDGLEVVQILDGEVAFLVRRADHAQHAAHRAHRVAEERQVVARLRRKLLHGDEGFGPPSDLAEDALALRARGVGAQREGVEGRLHGAPVVRLDARDHLILGVDRIPHQHVAGVALQLALVDRPEPPAHLGREGGEAGIHRPAHHLDPAQRVVEMAGPDLHQLLLQVHDGFVHGPLGHDGVEHLAPVEAHVLGSLRHRVVAGRIPAKLHAIGDLGRLALGDLLGALRADPRHRPGKVLHALVRHGRKISAELAHQPAGRRDLRAALGALDCHGLTSRCRSGSSRP